MSFVPLDRQFEAFRDDESRAQAYAQDLRLLSGTGWPILLEFQRVVVLASAGSGKSRELEVQAAALQAQGEFAFLATVRDIGAGGLAAALGASEADRLVEWQALDRTAWFFIDSVDEAKLDHPLRRRHAKAGRRDRRRQAQGADHSERPLRQLGVPK